MFLVKFLSMFVIKKSAVQIEEQSSCNSFLQICDIRCDWNEIKIPLWLYQSINIVIEATLW